MKKWMCSNCGWIYDEAAGDPGHGIPAGTRWQDVPDSWSCPDCSAPKSAFEMVEI
jgi:rubredoxin